MRRAWRVGALPGAAVLVAVVALALPAGALAQVSFGAASHFAAGDAPTSVAVGDFDGDSDPDLAVANFLSDNASVLLGNGEGSFGAATNFAADNGPFSVAAGDFDSDHDPDLAVANIFTNDVSVLLGNGGGSFGAATHFAAGDLPRSLAVGDLDTDSDPDLAVTNENFDTVSLLLNTTNRPPSAAEDAFATDKDMPLEVAAPGVLGNDPDPDGDALSAVLVSGPANGSLQLNADGSFRYAPTADFNGPDSFSYRASDGGLESDPVTVTIEVRPVDDPPPADPASTPPAGTAATPPAGTASTPSAGTDATPPAGGAAPAGPAAPAPAIAQLRLTSGCMRRPHSGRVRIRMRMRMARPRPVQVRIDRRVGTEAGLACSKPNPGRRFHKVTTLRRLPTQPAAAGRRLTLKLRLAPGLYRLTVRAHLEGNRLSPPRRRYVRVLG